MEQEFASIISSVGFPIFAFLLMYRMVTTQMKENTEAIRNNTTIMEKIFTIINRIEKDDTV